VLDSASVVKRSEAQVSCNLDDEVAVLSLEHSRYFGLDGVAAHIWLALEKPCSVAELCESVEAHFEVTPDVCRADVLKFLGSLEAAGLVEAAS
jgi:Coenzyme PQQ synthesis protein D (PqqD)